jgi:hypothetical protein
MAQMIAHEEEIPDEPKIPLNNYLLDLISRSDGKENSLYIRNAENFIREIWNEIVEINWRKLNVRKLIPKELGVRCSSFYAYKNGRKAISIQMLYKLLLIWKRYCNKTDEEVKEKWDEIFDSNIRFTTHSKHHNAILPKFITPKLSYIIGCVCGDGHFGQAHNYVISISEGSKDQLNYVLKPIIKELFDIDAPIFVSMGNGWRLQFGSKPVFRFFKNVLRIRVGEMPHFIWKLDKINKKYFLIGILDSEGYVNKSYLHSRITIVQSDIKFQNKLIKLFKELNFKFTGPHFHRNELGEWYSIELRKKLDIVRFENEIGFNHIDKRKKLRTLVMEIEKKWSCRSSSSSRKLPKMVI